MLLKVHVIGLKDSKCIAACSLNFQSMAQNIHDLNATSLKFLFLPCVVTYPLFFVCFQKASVPVDIMPGEYDPANHFMPQQPLHKCMFPKALSYPTVKSMSNPYEASIGGVRYVFVLFVALRNQQ